MNGDLSMVEHRTNPLGSRSGSDGGNGLSAGCFPGDEGSGPVFIVEVKVESEFVDDSPSQDQDYDWKLKVDPELFDRPIKNEAPLVKIETFQSNFLQTSQDALSYEQVKQELCDSSPTEPSKAEQLLKDLSGEEHKVNPPGSMRVSDGRNLLGPGGSPTYRGSRVAPPDDNESGPDVIVIVKSEFVDHSFPEDQDEAPLVKMETFQSNSLQTSQDALSILHIKQEPCDSSPAEPSKADQLLEVKEMKLVSCSNCSQMFCSEVLNRHVTHTVCQETDSFSSVSDNHRCKSCTETLNDIQGNTRPHKCSACKKSFTLSSSLKRHQIIHMGEKPYKCSVCDKDFASSSYLYQHQKIHTGEKPFTCSVCHKAFVRSSHLHRHQRTHAGEKLHKCSVCSKNFSSSYLGVHKKLHSREKPYRCSICSKDFVSLSHLHQHQKVHTGKKPHKCSVCLKAFVCSWHLQEHQRIHTGEKPHKCSVCLKAFRHFNSLNIHQRTHTGEHPYKCSVCDKGFICSSTMRRHERIHTTENISTSL
uniref:zinc finger protein 70-like n=1 Tax=Myxine glutinosa TaxID=7769 RepID=UPI00359011C1